MVKHICNVDALTVPSELTHQEKKALGPLLKLKLVGGKDIENPEKFQDAPMVTNFDQQKVKLLSRGIC